MLRLWRSLTIKRLLITACLVGAATYLDLKRPGRGTFYNPIFELVCPQISCRLAQGSDP
jgi:hypothetical protein